MNPNNRQIMSWERVFKIREIFFLMLLRGMRAIDIESSTAKRIERVIICARGRFCPKIRVILMMRSFIVVNIL